VTALGEFALWIALPITFWGMVMGFVGGKQERGDLVLSGERSVYLTFALLAIASIAITHAFLVDDHRRCLLRRGSGRHLPQQRSSVVRGHDQDLRGAATHPRGVRPGHRRGPKPKAPSADATSFICSPSSATSISATQPVPHRTDAGPVSHSRTRCRRTKAGTATE